MLSQAQPTVRDEFAFVLLAALIFIAIMLVYWTTPQEFPPSLEPKVISVRMLPNTQKILTFKVTGNLTAVNLDANGTLSQLISFPENNFNVYGEKEVRAILKSPVSYGKYEGYIIAKGKGGEDCIKVTVYVSSNLSLTYRSIPVEDFRIYNYGSERVVESKYDFVVERSLFSSKEAKLIFKLENMEIEELKLKLAISDAKGSGYLVVRLNGNTVFRKKVVEGFEEIALNVSDIRELNFITIGVENEGFGIFFKTSYSVYEAKVMARYKSSPYSFELYLPQKEIDDFHSLEFSSTLVQQNYPSVEIKVNNQKVFIGKLPISVFKLNISKDLLGNELLLYPKNNISFSLLTEGEIYFSNNIIKVYSYAN